MRHYYAVHHHYGRGTTTERRPGGGKPAKIVPAANLYRFASLGAARAFAAAGASYPREQGYREVLGDADPSVRSWARARIAAERRAPAWPGDEHGCWISASPYLDDEGEVLT
jgi:hypothetical protein